MAFRSHFDKMKPMARQKTPVVIGEQHGRWTVIGGRGPGEHVLCRCACGTERMVKVPPLLHGRTRSCGCLQRERAAESSASIYTHGRSRTPTYTTWASMLQRCRNPNNPSYPRYGGRGITVCERWLDFAYFLEDMGERPDGHSIDRIDNEGNYEPSNCRWATPAEQNANQRPNWRGSRICSVPGCGRRHSGKGLCALHYQRQYRAIQLR